MAGASSGLTARPLDRYGEVMKTHHTNRFLGIVLAAGFSRRAGTLKPALEVAGKPLLVHAVEGLRQRCDQVIVVVGHEAERVTDLVAERSDVLTVFNDFFHEDMFRSIQAGAAALPDDLDGFFILPVDCPQVSADVLDVMLSAFNQDVARRPIIPEFAGRGGHPVILPGSAAKSIIAARPPATLRTILNQLSAQRVEVPSDSIHLDLDTPEALACWKQSLGRQQDGH